MTEDQQPLEEGVRRRVADLAVRSIGRDTARRFLVLRHQLAPPRSLPAGPEGVTEVFRRLGSVQFDPLGVAGRNHDLVLHARVADYDPAWTEDLLYQRRTLFETYNKGLSLLPVEELPWYRITWDRAASEHRDGAFVKHAEVVEHVLARIRADGPLSSLDFERRPQVTWWWGPTNEVRAALEALAHAGVLALARREGNRRYYDLAERLFPAELLQRRPGEHEQLRHKLLSRYRAHGLLGASGQMEIFLGTGRARREPGNPNGPPSRAELLNELLRAGELVPVAVEGVKGARYVLAPELALLDSVESDGLQDDPAVSFLAPLDPLVWDRGFLRSLFEYDYLWEVYVPEAKRRWGYYVLPILFGDRFVGRIEPRIDRTAGVVRILRLWWEEGFDPRRTDAIIPAMRDALSAYCGFARATRVEWAPGLERWARLLGGPRRRSVRTVARVTS